MMMACERRTEEGQAGVSSFVGPRTVFAGFRPSSLTDTHCHLDLSQFDSDREAVIARAEEAGVGIIVNPAIDLDSCRRVLALAERHPNVYAAVGVHPNDCASFATESVSVLRELAQHPKVVAIGEIGLDYYRERAPHEQQKRALRAQLALAAELGLPVILHARNSQERAEPLCTGDLLLEIAQWGPEIRKRRGPDAIVGVWHAFSGGLAEAESAYDAGLVLGLGGPITFKNARQFRGLVSSLRPDRLVLETDAPYLAPHPHRGKRNEPANVALVAKSLAQLTGVTVEDPLQGADATAIQTTVTARQCFDRLA